MWGRLSAEINEGSKESLCIVSLKKLLCCYKKRLGMGFEVGRNIMGPSVPRIQASGGSPKSSEACTD